MTDTAHMIYAASVRQLAGVLAERDALMGVIAAKQAQVDALIAERTTLRDQLRAARAMSDKWRRAYIGDVAVDTALVFEVSAVTDDGAE
jgi:hypothetical protein